jgi:hypothetical protein
MRAPVPPVHMSVETFWGCVGTRRVRNRNLAESSLEVMLLVYCVIGRQ